MRLLALGSFVGALSPSSCDHVPILISMSDTNFQPRPAQDQRITQELNDAKHVLPSPKSQQPFPGILLRPKATQCIKYCLSNHPTLGVPTSLRHAKTNLMQSVKQVHATWRTTWSVQHFRGSTLFCCYTVTFVQTGSLLSTCPESVQNMGISFWHFEVQNPKLETVRFNFPRKDMTNKHILVGGWATPLKKMSSSIGMISNPIFLGK